MFQDYVGRCPIRKLKERQMLQERQMLALPLASPVLLELPQPLQVPLPEDSLQELVCPLDALGVLGEVGEGCWRLE
jgi:hypothetical protein